MAAAEAGVPDDLRAKLALVLIDFINPLDFPGGDEIAPAAEAAARAARGLRDRVDAMGGLVIYANDNYGQWRSDFASLLRRCAQGRSAARRISRWLRPRPQDVCVLKPRNSAFYATPLDMILRSAGCRRLILAGLATDNCIQFSAMDAYVHGYKLWVPADCTAAESETAWRSSLDHMARVLKAETRPAHQAP